MAKVLVDFNRIGKILKNMERITECLKSQYDQFRRTESEWNVHPEYLEEKRRLEKELQEIELELRKESQDLSAWTETLDTIMLLYQRKEKERSEKQCK